LEEILAALPHDGKYVLGNGEFPITEMTYKRGWERICRTINMHGATAHVLRHPYVKLKTKLNQRNCQHLLLLYGIKSPNSELNHIPSMFLKQHYFFILY